MNIRDLADLAGLSIRQLALHYEIPQRTVEDWSAGRRKPPDYVLSLLEKAILFDNEKSPSD